MSIIRGLTKVELPILQKVNGLANNSTETYLLIRDNGHGIDKVNLGKAIIPVGFSGGKTLNEHGLGMKQAVASLGTLKYLLTRSINEEMTSYADKFAFGETSILQIDYDWNYGTEICVHDLNSIVPTSQQSYTMHVVPYLGAKYRRFLKLYNLKIQLKVTLLDIDQIDAKGNPVEIQSWKVKEVKQIYFHPNKRVNKPILQNKEFKGKGWKAKFTFGYAPIDDEFEELGLEIPKPYSPYAVSIKKQGFDIIVHDRVINFTQFHELEFINVPHNSYNYQSPSSSVKIKFIFTVEEEVGLVGARNVDDTFLWGTDAVIVVDRRGTGDIVTSCEGDIPFCEEAYGKFIEQAAIEAGLSGWKCTQGGSSDTRTWAEHGIQSVNLSAGYHYEHSGAEY